MSHGGKLKQDAPWHERRGSIEPLASKQKTDQKVWLTLTDPEERSRGMISSAERNWHIQNAMIKQFKLGYLDTYDYAKVHNLPKEVAKLCCETAMATLRYVAQSGDGAALKPYLNQKLEDLYEEAKAAGSFEACVKTVELQARINGAMAASKAEITHKHDLVGRLTPEMKEYFIRYNALPREAFELLGYPVPDSAGSLQLPPAQPAEIIDTYLEEIPDKESKEGK